MKGKWVRVDVNPNAFDDTFVDRSTCLLNDHLVSTELIFPDYESSAHFYRVTTSNLPNERQLSRYYGEGDSLPPPPLEPSLQKLSNQAVFMHKLNVRFVPYRWEYL